MKWFDNWLIKMVKSRNLVEDFNLIQEKEPIYSLPGKNSRQSIEANGMHLNIYRANGGFIIENRVYDNVKDRLENRLYIVTEEKNLGEELAKIITFESLRS